MAQINQRALMAQLAASEPILKREADRVMRENYFDPAVAAMKEEFVEHPVTREIMGGTEARNDSGTLQGDFGSEQGKNLYSFIGFPAGDDPITPIGERLDPSHRDGPKMVYKGMDKNLVFRYEIRAPNEESIYKHTPMPWAKGLSWAKRIEVGIAGVGLFLNKVGISSSRSGGGIQVKNKIRSGRYVATSYLTGIFKRFLTNASGGKRKR